MQLVARVAALFARSLMDQCRSDYLRHRCSAMCIPAVTCVSSGHMVESLAEIVDVCRVCNGVFVQMRECALPPGWQYR
jgi:hypothetical protein